MKKLISTWYMSYHGMEIAKDCLKNGDSMQEALKHAIQDVESNPAFHSVGTGGLPNQDGIVELDGAYMDGKTLSFGGVMGVHHLKSPIEVCIDLSKHNVNCLLVGEGADAYALEQGFEQTKHGTDEAYQLYLNKKEEGLKAYDGHDTVCVLGYDDGHLQAGVSTSGLFMKHAGRVGDSPIIGSGFYADNELGACAATGLGEDVMRGCLSIRALLKAQSMPIQQALDETLDEHMQRMSNAGRSCESISLIAIDAKGNTGATTNIEAFPFVIVEDQSIQLYAASYKNQKHSIVLCDEQWLSQYQGD